MWFWIFMFFSSLLVPVLMMAAGRMMFRHPPKSINRIYGYRTSMSMKNMETWKFAHETCGKLWQKVGLVLFAISAVIQIPLYGTSDEVLGTADGILCMVQCVCLVLSIIPVERALKANFHPDGSKKSV